MRYRNPYNNRFNTAAWSGHDGAEDVEERIEALLAQMPEASIFEAAALFAQQGPKAARWRESADAYVACLELPGLRAADILVELRGDDLAVSAESRETIGEGEEKSERVRCYRRRVPVPEGTDLDGITADYEGGLLSVRLPKAQKAQRRVIPVRGD